MNTHWYLKRGHDLLLPHPYPFLTYLMVVCVPYSFHGSVTPSGPRPPHCRGFTITLRHTTLGRTPLDEWSARRRDLYLTTHNIHVIHTASGNRTRNPSKQAAVDPRLGPRGNLYTPFLMRGSVCVRVHPTYLSANIKYIFFSFTAMHSKSLMSSRKFFPTERPDQQ
jgi:hypothetical protein